MTTGYTLTWKGSGDLALADGSTLRPDTLGKIDAGSLSSTPLRIGRNTFPLGELFRVEGASGSTLTLRGMPAVDRLGALMQSGTLVVEGDAGDDLGASMRGGMIVVRGKAGHRAGGPHPTSDRGMSGGEIIIEGDAGDFVGLRQRRGLIVVRGRTGKSPGYRMLAGTIALTHGPVDHPGLEMRRGSVLCLDRANPVTVTKSFADTGTFNISELVALRLLLRRLTTLGVNVDESMQRSQCRVFAGDRFELNRGEVVQWLS